MPLTSKLLLLLLLLLLLFVHVDDVGGRRQSSLATTTSYYATSGENSGFDGATVVATASLMEAERRGGHGSQRSLLGLLHEGS